MSNQQQSTAAALKIQSQKPKDFGPDGLETWNKILSEQALVRDTQVHEMFAEGIAYLDLKAGNLPNIDDINEKLVKRTGFRGIYVDGLEEGASFFQMLSQRNFPVGNFIRDSKDVNYTPAPDIVHDLYGHLPFLADPDYANFCQQFGEAACKFIDLPQKFRQFERFFWFTIEFGLIETSLGKRVFGAGIASSIAECRYSLSDQPEVIPFDIDKIRYQEFRIDEMQKRLFILKSKEQLYESLPELIHRVMTEI